MGLGVLQEFPVDHRVQVAIELRMQMLLHGFIAMPKIRHPNPADGIKEPRAVGQMNPRSFAWLTSSPKGWSVVEAKPRLRNGLSA